MICPFMLIPASTELTEVLYILCPKKYCTPFRPLCCRPGAYVSCPSTHHYCCAFTAEPASNVVVYISDVKKDLSRKANVKAKDFQAKDLAFKAKAKDFTFKPNQALTWQGNNIGAYVFYIIFCLLYAG